MSRYRPLIPLALVLLAVLLTPSRAWASRTLLDAFDASGSRQWRALPGTPSAGQDPVGMTLLAPFSKGSDRYAWDRDVAWDLSSFTSFELELTCELPQSMRSLGIYLESGDGWYVWNRPLKSAGRQRLTLRRKDFSTEGKPAGWSRITGVRISPWKGEPRDAQLVMHRFMAHRDRVFIVEATRSAPQAGDRALAKRCASRMSDWLDRSGIGHAHLTEDELARTGGIDADILILPLNPTPTAEVIQSLRESVRRGARLVVCFSSSPELARLMNVEAGPYIGREHPRAFESIVFNRDAPPHLPERVYQSSWGIRPVQPLKGKGSVIAYWADADAKKSAYPACVQTDVGYWFTHILLLDDTFAKERMLLGLLGSLDPDLWFQAAAKAMEDAGRIDHFTSVDRAIQGISAKAGSTAHPAGIERALAEARRLRESMQVQYADRRFADTVESARALRHELTMAYSQTQPARQGEFRGVWDHEGTGWWPGNWNRTCETLAEGGMTAILPNLMWAGLAHYPSKVVPSSETFRRYGDQAAQCLKAARANGLEMHVWKICWNLEQAPEAWVDNLRKQGRLLKGANGQPMEWLDPSQEANVALELESIREFLRAYPVDGFHLDYIRYPAGLPRASIQPAHITRFVERARETVKAIRPDLKFSAAVWGGYPSCRDSVGQDWGNWVERGLLDFVCPMNYAEDRFAFTALMTQQRAIKGSKGRLYPGIGLAADESQLRADQVIDQIIAARGQGMNGYVLFDLCPPLRDEILPTLSKGITRPR